MKKRSFSTLLILLCGFIFFSANSFALDEGGCLTCHQYPGLVRLEETGKLKVLHIDESQYRTEI